jgi:uncharacterized LabA/DUF88 family protein
LKYLFIDGGFPDSLFKKTEARFSQHAPLKLNYSALAGRYQAARTFYYDAYPAKKPSQSDTDYAEVLKRRTEKYRQISLTPTVHIKEAVTRATPGGKALQQKGVDILLALDVFKAATRPGITEIHLMATDYDFFPLLEALRETSVSTYLHCYKKETNQDLMALADYVRPISTFTVSSWCGYPPEGYALVNWNVSFSPDSLATVVKTGMFMGLPMTIYESSKTGDPLYYAVMQARDSHMATTSKSMDDLIDDIEYRLRDHVVLD